MQTVIGAKPLRSTARMMIPRMVSTRYDQAYARYDQAYARMQRRIPRWVWMLPRRYWQPLLKRCTDGAQRISLKRLDRLCARWL